MPQKLPDSVQQLLQRPVLGYLATLMADGSPQVTPLWVDTDGEYIYVNTAEGRVKPRNVRRDPRVALAVLDPANPYQTQVQVRGRVVEVTTEGAEEHIHKLAKKYRGDDRYPLTPGMVRLKVKIEPIHVSGPGVR